MKDPAPVLCPLRVSFSMVRPRAGHDPPRAAQGHAQGHGIVFSKGDAGASARTKQGVRLSFFQARSASP